MSCSRLVEHGSGKIFYTSRFATNTCLFFFEKRDLEQLFY